MFSTESSTCDELMFFTETCTCDELMFSTETCTCGALMFSTFFFVRTTPEPSTSIVQRFLHANKDNIRVRGHSSDACTSSASYTAILALTSLDASNTVRFPTS